MVEREGGLGAWDRGLAAVGAGGAYTTLGSYPDAELLRLVEHFAVEQKIRPVDLLNRFGRFAFSRMMRSCPHITQRFEDSRGLLRGLNDVIHPEVRKLYPEAETPDFSVVRESSGMLELEYSSTRSLCSFALGMTAGAIEHFDERAQITHPKCRERGDSMCLLRIEYLPNGGIPRS